MTKFVVHFDKLITTILHGIKFVTQSVMQCTFHGNIFIGRVSIREQIIFMKRLSMMLKSGMPIGYCLRLVAVEKTGQKVSQLAERLRVEVESGRALSTAFVDTAEIKNPLIISMVRIGEASGTLPESLEYIAGELKARQEIRRQIVSALVYPGIIILATLGIAVFLITYIFPKITPIFIGLKAELPLSTKILLGLSQFLTEWYWCVILGGIFLVLIFVVVVRIQSMRLLCDRLLLALPFCGRFLQYYNLVNMCRTLGLLLASDVRIVESLTIVATCAPHSIYAAALTDVAHGVATGQLFSVHLERYPRLFPTLVVQMIAAGEKTGNLPSTLTFLSALYEADIREMTKNLTTILEPILMLTMGLIVGFIAISIITPIYGITQNLHP